MSFFIVTALVLCLYAIYQYAWGFSRVYEQLKWQEDVLGMDRIQWGVLHALKEKRVFSSFGNANVFAGFLAVAFPFLLASVAEQRNKWLRMALIVQVALTCVVLYLTKSRGGILCAVLAIVLTILMLNKQFLHQHAKTIRLAFLGVVVLILILAGLLVHVAAQAPSGEMRSHALIQRVTNLTTIRERLFYLHIGAQMVPRAPILGSGLGAYGVLYPQYRLPEAQESRYVHNFAAQLLIETGAVGLLLFLACAIGIIVRGIRLYWSTEDKRYSALLAPIIVACLIFLLNGLIEYTFYVRELFLGWCLIAGVILGSQSRGIGEITEAAPAKNAMGRIVILVLAVSPMILLPTFLIQPAMGSFYAYHGDLAVRENDRARALIFYRRAHTWDPATSVYAARLGRTQFDLGQFDAGILKMKRAIQLNPYSASLHDELAQAYRRIGQYTEAMRYQQKAVRCYPLHPLYHYHLSLLHEQLGDMDAAISEAEQALIIESPFQSVYQEHLKRLREKEVLKGENRDRDPPLVSEINRHIPESEDIIRLNPGLCTLNGAWKS
jgi:O-antigen ligase